jgi:hypothetical protein
VLTGASCCAGMNTIAANLMPSEGGHHFGPFTELAALGSEPEEWELDELGAPRWIVDVPLAHLCEWVALVPPPGAELFTRRWRSVWPAGARDLEPGAMPTLHRALGRSRLRRAPQRRRGNPGLTSTSPVEVRAAAWLRDVRGFSHPRIFRTLFGFDDSRHVDRSDRRRAERYVGQGRLCLYREGVLPWTLFAGGNVVGEWWNLPRLRSALDWWFLFGVRSPSLGSAREEARVAHGRMILLSIFEDRLNPPAILQSQPAKGPREAALRLGRAAAMLGHPTLHAASCTASTDARSDS